MKKQPYLPSGDKERRTWMNNYNTQLASLGPDLGISPAEIAATNADTLAVNYILDNLETFKSETQERTSYKDILFDGEIGVPLGPLPGLPTLPVAPTEVPAGVFKRIAKMVQRIKNHPAYNEALGKNLGIIGAEVVINYETLKVRITLRHANNDNIALDFVKGHLDGVVVYGGTFAQNTAVPTIPPATTIEPPVLIWTELVRVTKSPYVDTRQNATNQPETRYYKMRYLKDDVPVGKDSDTISVISNVGVDLANIVK